MGKLSVDSTSDIDEPLCRERPLAIVLSFGKMTVCNVDPIEILTTQNTVAAPFDAPIKIVLNQDICDIYDD